MFYLVMTMSFPFWRYSNCRIINLICVSCLVQEYCKQPMENQPKRKTCRGVPFRCVVRCSAERKLTFLLAGRQWSLQCMNKVLVKAQPTELVFSFPVTAVSERNQVSSLCSSGRWTTCSILFLLFVWKSKGTILRDVADSVCINHSSLWGNLPWGCTRRHVLWDICKGKSRQTVALLVRVGWRKPCCNTHQHWDLEEVKQGKNFQNISAHNRYNQGPLGFSQALEHSGALHLLTENSCLFLLLQNL